MFRCKTANKPEDDSQEMKWEAADTQYQKRDCPLPTYPAQVLQTLNTNIHPFAILVCRIDFIASRSTKPLHTWLPFVNEPLLFAQHRGTSQLTKITAHEQCHRQHVYQQVKPCVNSACSLAVARVDASVPVCNGSMRKDPCCQTKVDN